MADEILTRPLLQNADLFERPFRSVAHPGGGWVQFLAAEPQRVLAMVTTADGLGGCLIAPDQYTPAGLLSTASVLTPYIIHIAQHLLFTGGAWSLYSGPATTVYVWELVRLKGVD